jgi:hypothetical protein
VPLKRYRVLKIPPHVFSVPQRYCCHLRQHPRHQIKKANPKKFLQKFKSSVTFAPLAAEEIKLARATA